jgi:hypothetical protein
MIIIHTLAGNILVFIPIEWAVDEMALNFNPMVYFLWVDVYRQKLIDKYDTLFDPITDSTYFFTLH